MAEYQEAGGEALSGQEVRDLYEQLRGDYAGRNAEYLRARNRYSGEHWDGDELIADDQRYSLTINYLQPAVDMAVEDLFGMMPGLQVVPRSSDADGRRHAERLENLLYATWARNRMEVVLRQAAFNVVLARRGFIQYWWDPQAKIVRYQSIAPENVYPVMDGAQVVEVVCVSERLTRELKARYPAQASQIGSDRDGDDLVVDHTERPTGGPSPLTQKTKVLDWYDRHGNWVRVMGDAVHSMKLGYNLGRPPLVEIVNSVAGDGLEPHNAIDVAIELNLYLDQLVSAQADIIRKYADPPVIDKGTGQSPQAIRQAIRAGSVIPVRKDGDLRYLNWDGTMPEISAQIERVHEFIRDLTGQPATAFGETVTNQSGVMTNLSLTPTVKSTRARETMFDGALTQLNADTLRIYEKFLKGEKLDLQGVRFGRTPYQRRPFFETAVSGADIDGWYENRIKWPSALRVDDPVYVQTELSKMTSDPPAQSVYDTIENLGHEDVEAAIDRIAAQLEDPRFHPDRMAQAIDAATSLVDTQIPAGLEGLGAGGVSGAAAAAGSPDSGALADLTG